MIRHLNRNKTWIIIGLVQIFTGFVIIMHNQQLDKSLPPLLGLFDDIPIGVLYLFLGVMVLINFIWDFYWYYIRVVLVILSEMMFMLLFISYAMNDYVTGTWSFFSFYAGAFALDVLWTAYLEPPYKLLKGGSEK